MNKQTEIPATPSISDERLRARREALISFVDNAQQREFKPARSHLRLFMPALSTAAALVVVVLLVANSGSSSTGTNSRLAGPAAKTTTSTSMPSLQQFNISADTAPNIVLADVQQAVLASNVIIHDVETQNTPEINKPQISEVWTDQADGYNFRTLGYDEQDNTKPALDDGTYESNGIVYKQTINYASGLGEESQVPASTVMEGKPTTFNTWSHDTVLGYQTLDGTDTIHLSDPEAGMNREVWIDSKTALPVQITEHGTFGSVVIKYDWIPRDPSTLRTLFLPPIPSNIKMMVPPPGFASAPPASVTVSKNPPQSGMYCANVLAIDPPSKTVWWQQGGGPVYKQTVSDQAMVQGGNGKPTSDIVAGLTANQTNPQTILYNVQVTNGELSMLWGIAFVEHVHDRRLTDLTRE